MKKFLVIILAFILCVSCIGLCGCSKLSQNNFPGDWHNYLVERTHEASETLVDSGINDIASFRKQTELVAYTLDRSVPVEVTFLYQDVDKGSVYPLPSISCRLDYVNDYEFRELFEANLTLEFFRVLDEYGINDNGDVVGTIVHWRRTNFWGNKESYYSICDFDGDGSWDYRVKDLSGYDSMFFTSETNTDTTPCRVFDEYNIVGLSTGVMASHKEMFSMSDLSGKETFRDLEKLFKADAKPA